MDINSIFITQDEIKEDISGKVTSTEILETIPKNRSLTPIKDWQKSKTTEWRWRFLTLPGDRFIVEISYINKNSNDRIYFNRYGQWVKRDISPEFDRYVTKTYFCYSN